MKIPHGEIEACYANPSAWVKRKLGLIPPSGHARRGFNAAIRDAVGEYHKTESATEAHKALTYYLRSFKDQLRKQAAHDVLDNYIFWHKGAGVVVAGFRVRLSHELKNGLRLGGDLTRVDVDVQAGRYRAVLLGEGLKMDEGELRWPLIQMAIARQYGREVGLIDVGTQELSGGAMQLRSYSARELEVATSAADEMCDEVSFVLNSVGV